VLLFEGDDYVGRTVNLAARLADAAGPGEVLAADLPDDLPSWVQVRGRRNVPVPGLGRVDDVVSLRPTPEVERELASGVPAA
jgi:class 3 adenylate cyclase